MLTVNYIDVLNKACDLTGLTRLSASLSSTDNAKLQTFISKRLENAVRYHFWPDYMRLEQRRFKADYASGTPYAAPTTTVATVIYYPNSQKYYQNLVASTGNAPATLASGAYVTNLAYWAEAATAYSGSDWAASTAYTQGTIVRNPSDGYFYQCHTAHTSSSSFDSTKFGALVPFDRFIAYAQAAQTVIGDVVQVWSSNPRVYKSALEVGFELSQNGIQICDAYNSVWVWYRIVIPRLSGDTFSPTATYAVGNQVYFSSATVAGNFYDCVATTSAGESPSSAAAKWSIVNLPRMFEDYMAYGAYVDSLTGDGQMDKARAEEARLMGWLAREVGILTRQEQQQQRARVLVR